MINCIRVDKAQCLWTRSTYRVDLHFFVFVFPWERRERGAPEQLVSYHTGDCCNTPTSGQHLKMKVMRKVICGGVDLVTRCFGRRRSIKTYRLINQKRQIWRAHNHQGFCGLVLQQTRALLQRNLLLLSPTAGEKHSYNLFIFFSVPQV